MPTKCLDPAFLSSLLCCPAWGAEGVPRAPPLVIARSWGASALASSLSNEAPPHRASAEARKAAGKAPASAPC